MRGETLDRHQRQRCPATGEQRYEATLENKDCRAVFVDQYQAQGSKGREEERET